MAEFEVTPGRVLVSAYMGSGFEQYNDPRKAMGLLQELSDIGTIRSLGQDLPEFFWAQQKTLWLELAWLKGDRQGVEQYTRPLGVERLSGGLEKI